MSIFDFLDEDYFKLQEFLSILTDSLPKIESSYVKNSETLIKCLVEQNKAYGQKIIELFETLDNEYKKTTPATEPPEANHNTNNNNPKSPDFTSLLHKKISDYEDLIKKLTNKNEEFSNQIKDLSKQIEMIHIKYNQSNLYQTLSNDAKKNITLFNNSINSSSSPLQMGIISSTQETREESGNFSSLSFFKFNNEIAHELDNCLLQAEYSKICDVR